PPPPRLPGAPAPAAARGPVVCRELPYWEVVKATNEWAAGNLIGHGGYGDVYWGVAPSDGTVWAVKRARVITKDFRREVRACMQRAKAGNSIMVECRCCDECESDERWQL
ncbi:unnamed protein product, partial [Closterium sp. NIES-53]